MHLTDTSALALFLFGLLVFLGCQSSPAPLDNAAVEAEIDALLAEMTLEEKIGMIHASSSFTSGGVERLGIPGTIRASFSLYNCQDDVDKFITAVRKAISFI